MNSEIKEIISVQENNINETRLIFKDNDNIKEIILEGKGRIKSAVAEI